MQSHDIIKALLKHIPAKQVAQELGVSLSLVYKWAEAPIVGSGASNPIDRVEVLTRLSGDMSLLEWLCSRFDGSFVKRPTDEVRVEDFVLTISRIMIELGFVLGEFSTSTGVLETVSPAKAREIRVRWERTKGMIEAFILAAELGKFTQGAIELAAQVTNKDTPKGKITPTRYKRSLSTISERPRVPLNNSLPPPN